MKGKREEEERESKLEEQNSQVTGQCVFVEGRKR
jgi:hypothetical protein